MCKTLVASSSFPLSLYLTVLKHLSLAVLSTLVFFVVSSAIHNSSKYRSDNKSIHVTQAKFTLAGVDKLNFTHRKDCSDYYHQTCFDKLDILNHCSSINYLNIERI